MAAQWQPEIRARLLVDYGDGAAGGTNNFSLPGNLVGVGAGAEFGVGSRAFVRTELRYSKHEQGADFGLRHRSPRAIKKNGP